MKKYKDNNRVRPYAIPLRATEQELEYLKLKAHERGIAVAQYIRALIYPKYIKPRLYELREKFNKNNG